MRTLPLAFFQGARQSARALALSALLLAACGEDATGPDDGNGGLGAIVVTPQTATVVIGNSVQLTAAVTDSTGQPMSGILTWTSSNESRATVSSGGMVNALSAGSVTITASLEGLEGTSTISVTSSPTSPTLQELFSAYLGGSDKDMARDVAVMNNGTAIVVGSSQSTDFPGVGGVQGPSDAFVVAFGPDGQRLWSRIIGGSGFERAYAVEIAPSGDIVIAGRAGAGLPGLSGSFQPNFNGHGPSTGYGPQDGFVCTLDGASGAPRWCSYLGPSTGIVRDVAVGADGSIYLASVQDIDEQWPAGWTIHDLRTDLSQPRNRVLAKVSANGKTLVWLAQFDGTGTTPSVRVGADASPVVAADLGQDIRVTALAPDGRSIRYNTDVGGSDIEWTETHQLALDASGNAYVSGYTRSRDLPTSAGAIDRTFNGGTGDAFVVKLSPAGQFLAGTYLGGAGTERSEGIAVDGAGNVYLTGYTSSTDFPKTIALRANGGDEVFMTSLTQDLGKIRFSATLGGSGDDLGRGIAIGASGAVYVVGLSASNDWPSLNTTASFGGVQDGILAAFGP